MYQRINVRCLRYFDYWFEISELLESACATVAMAEAAPQLRAEALAVVVLPSGLRLRNADGVLK
jgi:hypothetical protein